MRSQLPLAAGLLACLAAPAFGEKTQPADVGDPATLGRGIQRTMTLLSTSTPERRHKVRILFYGQSITEQAWWKEVEADLRARFPHADLTVENRALGGFAAQNLVRTAEADLYPFQPDLLIFHVFGAHGEYEEIIRRTRKTTTAEILIQTDHVNAKSDWRNEPTDPEKITPETWSAFMNYVHLPKVIERYGCGFVDQRNLWKKHLAAEDLEAQDLLKDGVHLNADGEKVMAAFCKAALVKRDDVTIDPFDCGYVRTFPADALTWKEGVATLDFEGTRIDLVARPGSTATFTARIDGKAPSAHPELYVFDRPKNEPGGKWAPVAPIRSRAPLVLETWTLSATQDAEEPEVYRFTVAGSATGEDGAGRSDEDFVSKSGRVVIPAKSWNVGYAMGLARVKPAPAAFTSSWKVMPRFVDEWKAAPGEAGTENSVTIAHGLADAPHALEIAGPRDEIAAVRVYSPKAFPCPHHAER